MGNNMDESQRYIQPLREYIRCDFIYITVQKQATLTHGKKNLCSGSL